MTPWVMFLFLVSGGAVQIAQPGSRAITASQVHARSVSSVIDPDTCPQDLGLGLLQTRSIATSAAATAEAKEKAEEALHKAEAEKTKQKTEEAVHKAEEAKQKAQDEEGKQKAADEGAKRKAADEEAKQKEDDEDSLKLDKSLLGKDEDAPGNVCPGGPCTVGNGDCHQFFTCDNSICKGHLLEIEVNCQRDCDCKSNNCFAAKFGEIKRCRPFR